MQFPEGTPPKRTGGRMASRRTTHQSIMSARTTVLINFFIEVLAALLVAVGLGILVAFLIQYRPHLDPSHFTLFISAIVLFAAGWGTYIGMKIRNHIRLIRDYHRHTQENTD